MRIRKRLPLCHITAAPPPDHRQMWAHLGNEASTKQKEEIGDDDHEAINNDIRKIVNICDGGQVFNANIPLLQERSCNEDYKLFPLKKRRGIFDRNPNEEPSKMKSKTNKKCGEIPLFDRKPVTGGKDVVVKKSKRGNVIMEGSRCSRVNGRGWRCCQPTLVGYSLCEHHLSKGRLKSASRENGSEGNSQSLLKKRSKVGVVKARSMSSLLSQL